VHAKSASSQEIRALLTSRRLLLDKLRDVELSLRGILRGFGLKLGKVAQRGFEMRVRELVANHPMLQHITRSMLLARATLQREHNILHKALLKIVRRDNVCRQAATIGSKLEQVEIERVRRKPTESLDAHDCHLHGLATLDRLKIRTVDEALTLFSNAIELDPRFAKAYALAAYCRGVRLASPGHIADREEEQAEAERLARPPAPAVASRPRERALVCSLAREYSAVPCINCAARRI
jgi:hypothetical protein